MQNKFAEVTPRNFNPMSVPGLSDEARKALNAAFDAMSTRRIEIINSSEKNSEQVIEKMAAAARALGWPEHGVRLGDRIELPTGLRPTSRCSAAPRWLGRSRRARSSRARPFQRRLFRPRGFCSRPV